MKVKAEFGEMHLQVKEDWIAGNHQKIQNTRRFFPREYGPADILISIVNLQNCEKMNMLYFKLPSVIIFYGTLGN